MNNKVRILLVDDEVQITDLLKEILVMKLNCEVIECNDPTDAYNLLRTENFDLLSLDHRMPRLTGMALLKLVRSHAGPNQDIPTIIFTGYLEEAKSESAKTFDNVLFLEKPVKMDRYLNNVKMALEMKRVPQAS